MADTFRTITDLASRGAFEGTDEIEVQVSGETTTKKGLLSAIFTYIYNAIVASPVLIVLTTATQTLTNKTLTSPKINENVACSETATNLNKVGTHIAGTANKHAAEAITYTDDYGSSNVKASLDLVWNDIQGIIDSLYYSRQYQTTWTQTGTDDKVILEEEILAQIVPTKDTDFVVLPYVTVQIDEVDSGKRVPSALGSYEKYDTTINSQVRVDKIVLTNMTNGYTYAVTIDCRVIEKA